MAENYFRNISFNYDRTNAVPNPVFHKCVIEFFRSPLQEKKKFGIKETHYNGEFGFDRFEKDICPSASIQGEGAYELLGGLVPKVEIVSGLRKYACPFMSLWPPGIEGNEENDNNPKSTATIYVKAGPVKDGPGTGTFSIRFESGNPAVTINGKDEDTLSLSLESAQATPLTLECLNAFGDPDATPYSSNFLASACHINAYIEDEFEEDDVCIGRLIIIPNRFIYYANLIPVIVRVQERKRDGSLAFLNPYPQSIADFCNNELPDFLNNRSFNQALIRFRYDSSQLKELEIVKDEFQQNLKDIFGTELSGSESQKLEFVDNIEQLYQKNIQRTDIEYLKAKAREESKVDEKLQKYLERFETEFNYRENDGVQRNHANRVATRAYNHRKTQEKLQEYKDAVKKYDELLEGVDLASGSKLNKTHKIHVFFFADIEKTKSAYSSSPTAFVPAFSPTGHGTAYIFSSCLKESLAKELVAHEIGHAFGLGHTFKNDNSLDNEKYIDNENPNKAYYEQEIEKLNRIKCDKESELRNHQTPNFEKNLNLFYRIINDHLKGKQSIKHGENHLKTFESQVANAMRLEALPFNTEMESNQEQIEKLNAEIAAIDAQINLHQESIRTLGRNTGNRNLSKNLRRSFSLENFMDYQSKYSEEINTDFMYKMFNYRQGRIMQGTPYLQPVKIENE